MYIVAKKKRRIIINNKKMNEEYLQEVVEAVGEAITENGYVTDEEICGIVEGVLQAEWNYLYVSGKEYRDELEARALLGEEEGD